MESTTILTPPAPVFSFPSEPNIPEGPEYEKNINTISMHEEKFYQLQGETNLRNILLTYIDFDTLFGLEFTFKLPYGLYGHASVCKKVCYFA